jgi:hypothetical protein
MPVLSTKASCQRARLLEYLRIHGSITTLGSRKILDILHPAARVLELRERGHSIVTAWDWVDTAGGQHRVARYVLLHNAPVRASIATPSS